MVFYHILYSLAYIWPSVHSGLLSQSVQSVIYLTIRTVWSSITICTVHPIFGHQYSLVFHHNLYSLPYIWPSVQSRLLSQSVQSILYLAISIVCSIVCHQNSLVFYHNMYSQSYIWPSEQSGLLSQSVQPGLCLAIRTVWSSITICTVVLNLAISTVWSSITICTVCPIFGHQYSLVFYHNLYSLAYI